MLWAIAGAKGGVGTSTVAASIALESARVESTLLVDLAGDQADIVGLESGQRGAIDWLAAAVGVEAEALERLVIPVVDNLELLPAGSVGTPIESGERVGALVEYLRRRRGMVIVDVGVAGPHPADWKMAILAGADRRTLVVRACYLALRRARGIPFDFDDLVEIIEPGRALTTTDIEGVLVEPVAVRIPVDPAVARAVDAGLLVSRPPRRLRRLQALTRRRFSDQAAES